jgi:inner membrane protein
VQLKFPRTQSYPVALRAAFPKGGDPMFESLPKPRRIRDSVLFRLVVIALLILILMIPQSMVRGLIFERQARFDQVGQEVAQSWGGSQVVGGPVLTIPYTYVVREKNEKGKIEAVTYGETLRVLPATLQVEGRINPEKRNRGIFEAVVYSSDLAVSGVFRLPEIKHSGAIEVVPRWEEATLAIGVTEPRGIRSRVMLDWAGREFALEPGGAETGLWAAGLRAAIPNLAAGKPGAEYAFHLNLGLNGSRNLSFLPFGEQTTIALRSTWDSPKFGGAILPATRTVGAKGFEATWKLASYGRSYPQQWRAGEAEEVASQSAIDSSAVGVDLLIPVDAYQKTERSTKYSILFLVLTFLTFFLFELFNPLRLHPVQYLLVGAALCLFYVLLLSISEHVAFGLAYLVAAVPTVLVIGGYAAAILQGKGRALVLTLVLAGLYGYLYVLLQLEDYALLLGSTGLFVILAAVMYLTRKINWYGGRKAEEEIAA